MAKNEEASLKKQLQHRLQELEITSTATSAVHSELQAAVESYKDKTDSYLRRLEEAEITKAKAVRAEQVTRRTLAELEKTHADILKERQAMEERLRASETRIRDLETRLEEEGRETADLDVLRQRLAEEMEAERKQYQQDLAERDFTADQTRKKYQAELHQLTEDISSQRDTAQPPTSLSCPHDCERPILHCGDERANVNSCRRARSTSSFSGWPSENAVVLTLSVRLNEGCLTVAVAGQATRRRRLRPRSTLHASSLACTSTNK